VTVFYAVLAVLGYLWAFWVLYVVTMAFYRASLAGRLTPFATVLAVPFVALAIGMDLLTNWTIAALWFREWPRWSVAGWRPDLVTDRLSRYIAGPPCWQQVHAAWLCLSLLDCFDPSGTHCLIK
jgi:hypothetical protein